MNLKIIIIYELYELEKFLISSEFAFSTQQYWLKFFFLNLNLRICLFLAPFNLTPLNPYEPLVFLNLLRCYVCFSLGFFFYVFFLLYTEDGLFFLYFLILNRFSFCFDSCRALIAQLARLMGWLCWIFFYTLCFHLAPDCSTAVCINGSCDTGVIGLFKFYRELKLLLSESQILEKFSWQNISLTWRLCDWLLYYQFLPLFYRLLSDLRFGNSYWPPSSTCLNI